MRNFEVGNHINTCYRIIVTLSEYQCSEQDAEEMRQRTEKSFGSGV